MIKAAQVLLPSIAFAHSITIDSCLLPLLRPQDYSSSKGFRPISTTINTAKVKRRKPFFSYSYHLFIYEL
jgi:hypothetical protein